MRLVLKLILIIVITFSVLVGLRTLGQMIHPGATHYWVGRISSASSPYTPTNAGQLWYYWVASDVPVGQTISNQWADRISTNYATMMGASYQPTNAALGVYFNGTTSYLSNNPTFYSLLDTNNGSYWVVFTPNYPSNSVGPLINADEDATKGLYVDSQSRICFKDKNSSLTVIGGYWPGSRYDVLVSISDATNAIFYLDGVSVLTNNSSTYDVIPTYKQRFIGRDGVLPLANGNYYRGYIEELAFFTNVVAASDALNLHNYVVSNYGASLVLNLTSNLVGYWRLDEQSGSRSDVLGVSTLSDNGTVTYDTGKITNAAKFVSTDNEFLSCIDNTSLSIGLNQEFTIACWVNLSSLIGHQYLVTKYGASAAAGEYALRYDGVTFNQFRIIVSNGTTATGCNANSFGTPSMGTWYFVVCWWAGGLLHIQVNNGTVDTGAHANGAQDSNNDFQIGAATALSTYCDGLIDEVGIWKRVLTSTERTFLYNSGNGRTYPFTP